jgi:hypothetical protein
MTILTETLIELADRHTTLYHFNEPPNPAPLAFRNSDEYCELHRMVAAPNRTEYSDVHGGTPGAVLGKLSPAYRNHKYWSRHVSSKNYDSYPDLAWQNLLPLQAAVTMRIEFALAAEFPFIVRPVPRVLLYPFGWSTWISLRLTGPHEIPDLTEFLRRILTEKAFTTGADQAPVSLSQLFNQAARGVRADAFGGNKTKDLESSDTFIVTTVMAKHGGSPALGAFGPAEEKEMLRLVCPVGPLPGRPFKEHVFRFPPANDIEYVVFDDLTRFNWMEHLLIPKERNHHLLHCYHNNSFLSLIQADHFLALLGVAGKQKSLSEALSDLTQTARDYLTSPSFSNASLRAFLERPAAKKSLMLTSVTAKPLADPS